MRKILSLLLMLFIFLGVAQATFAKPNELKFIQVSDVHFVAGREDSQIALNALVEEINTMNNIEFVIFTGDNIDNPNPENLHKFLKTVNRIDIPKFFVIGNHDVAVNTGLNKDRYIDIIRHHNWFYPAWKPNYVFKKKGIVFVVVDGAKQVIPGPNGYYKQDTLDWLDKTLTKYKKKNVIIIQHFPVVEPKKLRSHSTYKAEKYLEVLDKHENVMALISGHYHTNKEDMRNGVYHVSTPAFAEEPHPYKLIEIVRTKNFLPMMFTQLRAVDL